MHSLNLSTNNLFLFSPLIEITFDFFVYRLSPRIIIVRDYFRFDFESQLSLSFLDWSAINRLLSTGKLKFSITISLRLVMLLSDPSEIEDPLLPGLMRSLVHKRNAARGASLSYLSPASRNFFCALRNEVSCLIQN